VLGCTHYPFAADTLRGLVGPAVRLLDTGDPVAQQLARRLATAALCRAQLLREACMHGLGGFARVARHSGALAGRASGLNADAAYAGSTALSDFVSSLVCRLRTRPRATFTGCNSTRPTTNKTAVDRMAVRWSPPVAQVMAP
jgi:hypothetical protein